MDFLGSVGRDLSDRFCRSCRAPVEAERLASQVVMNDSSLHRGDIVSTDRGFFLYRGRGPDGYTNDFVRVPNPISLRFP